MKTELVKAVLACRLSENDALNLLQDRGVVSDLCLKLADVAEQDCPRAVGVLLLEMRRKKLEEPCPLL